MDFYTEWPADSDRSAGRRFGGSLVNWEKSCSSYDPNDASPWIWNCRNEIFAQQFDSSAGFLTSLLDNGTYRLNE